MSNKIKILFIGTSDFGIPSLKALMNCREFKVISVITQEDKKIGRKQILTPTPIKKEAGKYNIPILQPKKIIEVKSDIKRLNPDIIVLIAYGQKIPEDILNMPKYGSINLHGSLLPKYRGSSCIQAPILNGDDKTGITIMKMDSGLDTGKIIKQDEIQISPKETALTLHKKLSDLGAKILINTLKRYISGEIKPYAQNSSKASYVNQLKKEDGKINFDDSAEYIERMIRALDPWPSAYAKTEKNIILKILKSENIKSNANFKVGEIFMLNKNLAVKCGKNALIIKELQLSGKNPMNANEFLKGHKDIIGTVLK